MNSTSSLFDCVNISCLFLLFNILVLCIHDCIFLYIVFDKILEYQYLIFGVVQYHSICPTLYSMHEGIYI